MVKNENVVVVTRHAGLVDYLVEEGIVGTDVPVISHASAEDVRGKHVIGVLPLSLAAEADKVTEVPLRLTPELRGVELSLDQVREIAGDPVTYKVSVI